MLSLVKKHPLDAERPEILRQWYTLQVFNLYRFFLCLLLVILYWFGNSLGVAKGTFSVVYASVSVGYLLFSMICMFCTHHRKPDFELQAITEVFIDIIALIILMHVSHNAIYGFGILINAAIAGGSIITAGRISLLFAAVASIVVLLERALSNYPDLLTISGYQQTGVLGATFFATAISAFVLSNRIRASEALASERGVDLLKLEKVSDMIIQRMHSGVILVDNNDRVRMINQAAWYLLGLPKRLGTLWVSELSSQLMTQLKNWQDTRTIAPKTFQSVLKGQGVMVQFMSLTNTPGEKLATLILLEDTVRMTQQAQQMKLASLGRLTASIAHEIRNPLSAISHAAQLLAESEKLGNEDIRLLEIIRAQSGRVNEVIENILQLSRRKQAAPEIFKLRPWLEQFVEQYCAQTLKQLAITIDVSPVDMELFTDISQLQQILTNLCENGLRFSEQKIGKPILQIVAGLIDNTQEPFINVIDYGVGVSPEVVEYIFEPFFTTKQEGTGLGLYVAKELCEANRIRIGYSPASTGGSCFSLVFGSSE